MTFEEYLSSLKGKTVGVIGVGVSNRPLIEKLLERGIDVTARDKKEDLGELGQALTAQGCKLRLGSGYLADLHENVIFRTPGLRPDVPELAAAVATSLKAFARISGVWEQLFEDNTSARYFDFTNLNFGKITFSCDDNPKTLGEKISIKKVDKAGFRIENGEVDEPFGLNNISIEYVETGYYKR